MVSHTDCSGSLYGPATPVTDKTNNWRSEIISRWSVCAPWHFEERPIIWMRNSALKFNHCHIWTPRARPPRRIGIWQCWAIILVWFELSQSKTVLNLFMVQGFVKRGTASVRETEQSRDQDAQTKRLSLRGLTYLERILQHISATSQVCWREKWQLNFAASKGHFCGSSLQTLFSAWRFGTNKGSWGYSQNVCPFAIRPSSFCLLITSLTRLVALVACPPKTFFSVCLVYAGHSMRNPAWDRMASFLPDR